MRVSPTSLRGVAPLNQRNGRNVGKKAAQKNAAGEKKSPKKKPIKSYEHKDKKRANNPPVGLVTPDTDPDAA